jgi:hypothetical protein
VFADHSFIRARRHRVFPASCAQPPPPPPPPPLTLITGMTESKVVIEDELSERQLPTLSDFDVGEELAWGSLATV